jgi:ABC-type multidrug transport system ATPase subunit
MAAASPVKQQFSHRSCMILQLTSSPSGAGKTSLLTVLSGRNVTGGSVKVNAVVRLEDRKVDPCNIEVRKQIAYVAQDDSLMVSQTPRDAIRFSAKLRLSKTMTEDDLDVLTNTMLKELGLDSCADTLVGGAMLKGISGGERKRTSVGVELVTKPTLVSSGTYHYGFYGVNGFLLDLILSTQVFLDEPTSGLDSFSATQVCSVLRKVADSGASVLLTIHQPSSDIFQTFDLLILMNKGRIMYQGKVEDVDQYFEVRHHPLPPKFNPADHIMLVAQTVPEDELVAQGFFEEDPRPALEEKENCPTESVARNEDRVGFAVQLKLLVKRELMSLKRNKIVLGYRLFLTSFSVTLMGIIFWRVGDTDSSNPAVSSL